MLVGYQLIDTKTNETLQSWGGSFGSSPDAPNSFLLPNGDVVCGVLVGQLYHDRYKVIEWFMDAPAPPPINKDDVNAERDSRISGGILFRGNPFQSRPEDRENVAGAVTWATLAMMSGAKPGDYRWHGGEEDFGWIALDNTIVKMDAPTVIEFGKTLAAWKSAHIFAARVLKDLPEIPADYRDPKYWPAP